MIRKIGLSFSVSELEQQYKEWYYKKTTLSYSIGMTFIVLMLILIIIQHSDIIQVLVGSCVSLILCLVLLFTFRKYPKKSQSVLLYNYLLLVSLSHIIRIYSKDFRWENSYQLTLARGAFFLLGNQFISQTFFFVIGEFCGLLVMDEYEFTVILELVIAIIATIFTRYKLEYRRREHFLASSLQEQYEKMFEDLLPVSVVLVKYDKFQAQLIIDKINQEFKFKMGLDDDMRFRDFIRKLQLYPFMNSNSLSLDNLKLEPILIKLLQSKSEEKNITKYYGVFETDKKYNFQISQIYFNKLEPTVMLLFQEVAEDKYEQLQQSIYWRDQQLANHCKSLLKSLSHNITLYQYFKSNLKSWQFQRNTNYSHMIGSIENAIQKNYCTFNESLNLFNLLKLQYNQIKYDVNEFDLKDLNIQLGIDMRFSNVSIPNSPIMTDKQKLISIIISLSEFIRLTMSLHYNDERIMTESDPFGMPIWIKFKASKLWRGCYQVSMGHSKLIVEDSLNKILQKHHLGSDHRKRHWGLTQYFQSIKNISDEFLRLSETTLNPQNKVLKKQPSFLLEGEPQSCQKIEQKIPIKITGNTEPFSTLGYPLAQYFVSQLGPCNKIFISKIKENPFVQSFGEDDTTSKLKFLIYQDLNSFIVELNHQPPNPLLDLFSRPTQLHFPNININVRSPTKKVSFFHQQLNGKYQ